MFTLNKLLSASSASKKLLLGSSRKTRIVSASALLLAVCAFGAAGVAPMAPDADDLPIKSITQELQLPHLADQIAALDTLQQNYISEERVRSGDTLATLLNRLGVDDADAANFIKSDAIARNVMQLKAGKRVQVQTTEDGELNWLSSTVGTGAGNLKNIEIRREGKGFKATEKAIALEKRIEMRSGEIRSSLFAATDAAQIPDNVASQIVDMFSTNIDFGSDLRRGDRFNVVYETFWQNGEYVYAGRVLAGEFMNGPATYQSVWFDDPSVASSGGYYGFDGKSLKKAFLKSPLEFSRISSGFSVRKHPISGLWKAHKGVDFAAAIGTPIRASGDGVIDFAGTQRGYGNVVIIKHWSKYSTAYAHMSRFATNLRKGTKVSQGQVIGYVGMTGWSTGPHLHYEFRVNNEARDPMSVDIPNAQPLTASQMQKFRTVATDMTHRFALLSPENSNVRLAAK
ncbi:MULTISPECIES: peptidoglycan DD-metalloendopeptidase family protein [Oxalobacteraceae]|jgi:murein DD-endopeptidase MepM/ murein hydrolase activator NlpD|uniref:Peptidoglycan DD-metalloendopeptidase family protein n=1 Tax=Herminiimonas contaminans TaxID=1111140 RepID=A0ABS0EUB2_9BURK|nr:MULTISPECIES: peptidoglycan DD-metalloendopeptidase family protein [Oxalobacteraceae]MBF8177422.1 peptidoglycan DD-metalloendopeptidase family protein [Herminiimonas contaminans]